MGFEADHYLLFDFPGQVELFTLHSNAKNVILEMVNKWNFRVWFWNSAVYITFLSEFSFSQDKSPLNKNANLEIAEVNHVSFQPSKGCRSVRWVLLARWLYVLCVSILGHQFKKVVVSHLWLNLCCNLQLTAVHLVDAHLCSDPGKYVSALLMSLSTMLHLELPHVNVLSKIDLIESYGKLGTPPIIVLILWCLTAYCVHKVH